MIVQDRTADDDRTRFAMSTLLSHGNLSFHSASKLIICHGTRLPRINGAALTFDFCHRGIEGDTEGGRGEGGGGGR